ncbi:MAG: glycosyltransferase family 4 protein [Deltaproteobacteria bacterium]|jgi:glycosyltransferase involved in cell wall biosynthesis|nr:glycosyltransferase family 4 protein [Deltaproteobacteria bacterium]MBW2532820.1 glycosyltransferase family 4 protein [Deltaproteobacteria bacterium]
MAGRVLHVLSQRPLRTGSGITLDALVRNAHQAGWEQWAAVGTPLSDPEPPVGGLPATRVRPLRFGSGPLPFALPGMSDVMPYESSRFSALNGDELAAYRQAWADHLRALCAEVRPDVIHVHHVWLVSSLLKDVAQAVPVVNHCHATGLRQMDLCPRLADEVRAGAARNERFVVLHAEHRDRLAQCLQLGSERVVEVGAGYRDDLFHPRGRRHGGSADLVYVGKLSFAKGLPQLLDAFERLELVQRAGWGRLPGLARPVRLHVVGSGAGPEAAELRERIASLAPSVIGHGSLDQPALADLLRQSAVCALPSFYEGLPLVLVEAIACGCRVVATALSGVMRELVPRLGSAIEVVPLPRLVGPDTPLAADLPQFVGDLTAALRRAAQAAASVSAGEPDESALAHFTWPAVFRRVERVWQSVMR